MTHALALALALLVLPLLAASAPSDGYSAACSAIGSSLTSGGVLHSPETPLFDSLSRHWVNSSSQVPACVVEPETPEEIGQILRILGQTRTPFAVQGGGHTLNPRWSSTDGVHISLNSFNSIDVNVTEGVVEFGAGLRWGDVYNAMVPYNATVVGGRAVEVGVAGFTLGGGYGWKTNQYGLSLDTAVAFELVKPDGEVVRVTEIDEPDLFFGLRGAQNNFGVVTKITLRAVPQGQTWGGQITYTDPSVFTAVSEATAKFSKLTDPKIAMVSAVTYAGGMPLIRTILFYDGPTPPAGIFDDFLNIASSSDTIGTQANLVEFISNVGDPWQYLEEPRARQHTVPVPEYSVEFLELVNNVMFSLAGELNSTSLLSSMFVVEPFLPDILSHSQVPSAYPFDRSKAFTPCALLLGWVDPAEDEIMEAAMKRITDTLEAALIEEGQEGIKTAPLYSNYAIWDTPLDRIYGTNLPRLREIKAKVDPEDVMGLAGGFKV